MRNSLMTLSLLLSLTSLSQAANFIVTNVDQGPGDMLYADSGNNLLSNDSIVTMGLFTAGFDVLANINNHNVLISNYTIVFASASPGTNSDTLGGSFDGYVEGPVVDGALIDAASPNLGRMLYSFIGNASSIGSSSEIALVELGVLQEDAPLEYTRIADPKGQNILIGNTGTFVGDAGAGNGTYSTLRTVTVIPEPSSMVLALVGALALLRRRR